MAREKIAPPIWQRNLLFAVVCVAGAGAVGAGAPESVLLRLAGGASVGAAVAAASDAGVRGGGERPDGAWIYPHFAEEQVICSVAWWDEGVLHNITQICLTSREHLNELTEHLTATTWAGEM